MILLNCSQPGPRGISEANVCVSEKKPCARRRNGRHHLRLALAEHVERRPPRPLGHVPVRVRLELGAAEVDVENVARVQICQ